MEFDDIPISEDIIPLDHLPVILFPAPDAGKFQFLDKIFMNLGGEIEDGASLGQDHWIVQVGSFARSFCIGTDGVQDGKNLSLQGIQVQVLLGRCAEDRINL